MDFIVNVFNIVLYRPLFNLLILLYQYLPGHDFGVAVVFLTILIKFLLYPLGNSAIRSQKALTGIQPKVKEIQEKYKDNKEEQARLIMELYKKEKINPFSGFLPLLIQFPILIALYRVFWKGLQPQQFSSLLYGFVPHIDSINASFLGIIDLSHSWFLEVDGIRHYLWPNIILIILVGIAQFFQTKMNAPKIKTNKKQSFDFSSQMQKQMQYFFPFFTILILLKLPLAIGLYWLATTLFTIIQQYFIFKPRRESKLPTG